MYVWMDLYVHLHVCISWAADWLPLFGKLQCGKDRDIGGTGEVEGWMVKLGKCCRRCK